VVYAKPEGLKTEQVMTGAKYEVTLQDLGHPESKLEKELTLANAESAVRALEKTMELMIGKVSGLQTMGLWVDASVGSVKLHEPTKSS
jgi:hypothetical protein